MLLKTITLIPRDKRYRLIVITLEKLLLSRVYFMHGRGFNKHCSKLLQLDLHCFCLLLFMVSFRLVSFMVDGVSTHASKFLFVY